MKRILFICSANIKRSKTAEDYYSSIRPEIEFKSAGTNKSICQKEGTNYLSFEDLEWAEWIYVMETKHKKEILNFGGKLFSKKISILNIPDRYKYYQKELIEILQQKLDI